MEPKQFSLYGNRITPAQDRKALEWQQMFVKQFDYDRNEQYELRAYECVALATGTTWERSPNGNTVDRGA